MSQNKPASLTQADKDILPIFVVRKGTAVAVSFEGSCFLIAPGLIVTCWHCVTAQPPPDHHYAVIIPHDADGPGFTVAPLLDISRDYNGHDIATARVQAEPTLSLRLGCHEYGLGTRVLSFGYPFTTREATPTGGYKFTISPRYVEGYVTRTMYFEPPGFPHAWCYELDIKTPAGLSGAPVIRFGSTEVIGLVQGCLDVATIEERVEVDPDTGHRSPEVQRIVSFGIAYHYEALSEVRGAATAGRPLGEIASRT